MIQFFKYFWLSLLIAVLSISMTGTVSAKVNKSKKIAKVSQKSSLRKKKGTKKLSDLRQNLLTPPPMEDFPSSPEEMTMASSASSIEDTTDASPLNDSLTDSAAETVPLTEGTDPSTSMSMDPLTTTMDSSSPGQRDTETTDVSSVSVNPLAETQEQISSGDAILNEEIVTSVTEKTPQEALMAKSPAPSAPTDTDGPKKENDFLTLKDALEGAYAQSPLLTAEYQVKAAQMALSGAKRDWLPKTSASVGYTKNGGDYVNSRGLTSTGGRLDSHGNFKTGTSQGALSLQQNLYSGGSTIANILAQEKSLDATLAVYMITLRDTLFSAIQSFIQLSTRQEVFRLNKASQALLERQLDVAQNRYEFGELTRYDVAATQAKLDKSKAEVISALAEVEIAKANFVKVTGITIEKSLEKPTEPSALIPASKAEAIQIALKLSPELHKQEALAEVAKAETDKTFGGLLPSFDLSASASRTLTDNWDKNSYFGGHGNTRREQVEAGATLSIPLDFRGSTQSSIRQQKYVAAQKRLTAIYERRNVMELVSKYWDSLEAARARINQLKSQVNASKIAVETVTEEFLAGNKTTLDVLTAEQELFSAQVELVNAEQSVILNSYQLLATIGRLDVETLALNVHVYDPKAEYNEMPFWGINIAADERIAAQEFSTTLMKDADATQ